MYDSQLDDYKREAKLRKVTLRNFKPPIHESMLNQQPKDIVGSDELIPNGEGDSWNELMERAKQFIEHELMRCINSQGRFPKMDVMLVTHPCFAKEFLNAVRKLNDPKYRIEFSPNLSPMSLSLVKISRNLYFPKPQIKIMMKNDTSHLFTNQTQMTIGQNIRMREPPIDTRRIVIRCPNHYDSILTKRYKDEAFNNDFPNWQCKCQSGYINYGSPANEPIYECRCGNCDFKCCLLCAYTDGLNPVLKKSYDEGELPYYKKTLERHDNEIKAFNCLSKYLKFYKKCQPDLMCQSVILNDGKPLKSQGYFHITKSRQQVKDDRDYNTDHDRHQVHINDC